MIERSPGPLTEELTKGKVKMANATLSAKEIAAELSTTPRKVRKFLRSQDSGVGRGNRYSVTSAQVKKMKKAFDAWVVAEDEA